MHGQAASELLVGALWELPGLAMGRGSQVVLSINGGSPKWMVYKEKKYEHMN